MVDTTSMEGGGGTTSAAMRATTEFQISNKWRYSREVATASPERTKVWTEPSNSNSAPRRVPVIYYLYRNGHLEHPHFMEVPLSSSDGLYLKGMCNSMSSNHLSGIFSMIIHSNFPYRLLWEKSSPALFRWQEPRRKCIAEMNSWRWCEESFDRIVDGILDFMFVLIPHFIFHPWISTSTDVIHSLNLLRGTGMAAMYSWSSKR